MLYDGTDCIHVSQDRGKLIVVNTVINLRVTYKGEKFLDHLSNY